MKKEIKIFAVLMCIAILTAVFCGCNKDTSNTIDTSDPSAHAGDISGDMRWFDAEIKTVSGASITVAPLGDSYEARGAGEAGLVVTTKLADGKSCPELSVGDVVRITYDGLIAETYPAQILKVFEIEVK